MSSEQKFEAFVANFPYTVSEQEVKEHFAQFCNVFDVRLPTHQETGNNRGFGFLKLASEQDLNTALGMDGQEFMGRPLKVKPATGESNRRPRQPFQQGPGGFQQPYGQAPYGQAPYGQQPYRQGPPQYGAPRPRDDIPNTATKTIFIGGLDVMWDATTFENVVRESGIVFKRITLAKPLREGQSNRGYGFLVFNDIPAAQTALATLQAPGFRLSGREIKCNWGKDISEPEGEERNSILCIYVEDLPSNVDEQTVRNEFGRFGNITEVRLAKDMLGCKRQDFAFINYDNHDAVEEAIKADVVVDGRSLRVTLARPNQGRTGGRSGGPSRRGPMRDGGYQRRQAPYGQQAPRQGSYGAPPMQQGGYGAPPMQQQNYGAPPMQQNYGAPQTSYGAPPMQQGYGAPVQGYGAPMQQPQQAGYVAPAQGAYNATPAQTYGQEQAQPQQAQAQAQPQQQYYQQPATATQGYEQQAQAQPQQQYYQQQ